MYERGLGTGYGSTPQGRDGKCAATWSGVRPYFGIDGRLWFTGTTVLVVVWWLCIWDGMGWDRMGWDGMVMGIQLYFERGV